MCCKSSEREEHTEGHRWANWTEDVEWNHVTLMVNGKLPLEPVSTVVENCFCCHLVPLDPPVAIRFGHPVAWHADGRRFAPGESDRAQATSV